MKKRIITTLSVVAMFVAVENATAQRIISADFPTTNATIGATAGVSLSIWRLELLMPPSIGFLQFGYGLQLFEERMTIENQGSVNHEYHLPRFSGMANFRLGYLGFKITERDIVRAGLTLNATDLQNEVPDGSSRGFVDVFFEYAHTRCISRRTSLDLSTGIGYAHPNNGWSRFYCSTTSDVLQIIIGYTAVEFGVRLNYEIVRNLNFGVRLGYTRRFINEVRLENPEMFRDNFTRNFLDFSVGLHYRLQILSPFAVGCGHQQRLPRQRQVAPHRRALPCPPGQIQHQRSWDRPPSVFNRVGN